ncbi:MAG TPA: sensor histidine kinase [Chitinophagaceae bacterium]|nr:sensor histidine kinase [Chitinophagaceae bacterium]
MSACIFPALLLLAFPAGAQPAVRDSLLHGASAAGIPEEKGEWYLQLAEKASNARPDTAYYYATRALPLLPEGSLPALRAEFQLASFYLRNGKGDSALLLIRKNLPLLARRPEPGAAPLLVNYCNLQGHYYMRANRQKEALEHFYQSLKIADAAGDPLSQIKATTNIGWALMELNQMEPAIGRFKKAAGLMEAHSLPLFATVYNNIASCYGKLNLTDSGHKYVRLGIELARRNRDRAAHANGLNILGTLYQSKGRLKEALDVYLEAKEIREEIGDPFFIVSDMAVIANLYAKMGRPANGLAIVREALHLASRHGLQAKLPMLYEALAINFEADGDYPNASLAYKKISELKDSIYAAANPQALAEMQTRYETGKKERQIQEQEFALAKKNYWIGGIFGLLVLGSLLAYFIYRQKQLAAEKKLQQALLRQQEAATRAVLEAEEAERQRIAKDLHDGVGQMMSAAKMNLSAYEHEAAFRTPSERLAFEKIIQLVDDSCREVRQVSHNMMPNALLQNNLAAALREFLDKLDHKALKVHLYTEGLEERLDSNVETVLYRVIQECVNNVIRHSGANTLDISILREAGELSATIEDNGRGFRTDASTNEGIGLRNIRTRIEYLKGTVEIDSAPGKGTAVVLHVPLAHA